MLGSCRDGVGAEEAPADGPLNPQMKEQMLPPAGLCRLTSAHFSKGCWRLLPVSYLRSCLLHHQSCPGSLSEE